MNKNKKRKYTLAIKIRVIYVIPKRHQVELKYGTQYASLAKEKDAANALETSNIQCVA